jgi:hypothetical protein
MPVFQIKQVIYYSIEAPTIEAASLKAEKNLHIVGNFDYKRHILWNDTEMYIIDPENPEDEKMTEDFADIDYLDNWKAKRRAG